MLPGWLARFAQPVVAHCLLSAGTVKSRLSRTPSRSASRVLPVLWARKKPTPTTAKNQQQQKRFERDAEVVAR